MGFNIMDESEIQFIIMQLLIEHDGHVPLQKLIRCTNFSYAKLFCMLHTMEKNKQISLYTRDTIPHRKLTDEDKKDKLYIVSYVTYYE